VADDTQRKFLGRGLAHLTQYALQHQYQVAHVVQEVGSGLDGSRLNWKVSEPRYKAVSSTMK
jgi:predicted site-specific integrase-resolvase